MVGLWLCLVLLFCSTGVFNKVWAEQAQAVQLNEQLSHLSIGSSVSFFHDYESALTIQDVMRLEQKDWTHSTQDVPTLGYIHHAVWFRVDIEETRPGVNRSFLELSYPTLNNVEFFLVKDQSLLQHHITGDEKTFSQRPLDHTNFVLPLITEQGTAFTVYIRILTSNSLKLPLSIWEAEAFAVADRDAVFIQGLYFGLLTVMVLYNFFLYTRLRDENYLYYIAYVSIFLIYQFGYMGYGFKYVWSDSPWLQNALVAFCVNASGAFAILFTNQLLKLRERFPLIYRINLVAVFILLANGVLHTAAYYKISGYVSIGAIFPFLLEVMILGPYLALKGDRTVLYFTLAWIALVIGVVLLSLAEMGIIEGTFIVSHGFQFGSALEVVLLSLALAERMHQIRKEKYLAQQQVIEEAHSRERIEQQLLKQSFYDRLTGLPNLLAFRKRFVEIIDEDRSQNIAMMMVYFNRFYEINNTLGFQTGDSLLRLVTKRLNERVGKLSNVYNLSRDEYHKYNMAVVGGVTYVFAFHYSGDYAEIEEVANYVFEDTRQPVLHEGMLLDLGVHIGVTTYPELGKDVDSLLRQGEIAKEASQESEHRFALYNADMDPYSERRLTLMGELRHAIEANLLQLYYQPQVDIQTNEIIGVEALLRWVHPEHGFIPPDEFIPLAEKTGLIKPLTQWVVDTALRQLSEFREEGLNLTMAINISAKNLLEADLYQHLISLLDKYKIPHSCLILEITETAMMIDPDNALAVLTRLHDSDIHVSIDDFGTGYSSLAYLKQLPVDEIKIDRSFVMEMPKSKDDLMIVNTTLNMSHSMGMKVVAEGIEDEETYRQLKTMGCDIAQGYFLARPLPVDDLRAWIKESTFNLRKIA